MTNSSELLFPEGIGEEEEGGAGIGLLLLVRKGEGAFGVEGRAGEDLEFIVLAYDELDHFGGTLLESGSALRFASLGELLSDSLKEDLDGGHKVLLGEGDLVKLERVNKVDDGLTTSISVEFVISSNLELLVALGNVAGSHFPGGTVVLELVGVGVREHLVSGNNAFEYFHWSGWGFVLVK